MPERSPFKQVDEKHVSAEVTCMQWSPKMDLIVVANIQAEVVLYRLSWQKVWTLAAPCDDCKVTCLAWRTDGKVVAVGYNTGRIQLCDVENGISLHTLALPTAPTSLCWVAGSMVQGDGTEADQTTGDVFQDMSSHYLPKLPTFSKGINKSCFTGGDENVEDSKRLKGQKDLNILVTGTEGGRLHLYAYGVFPVGEVDVSHHSTGKSGQILHACLSEDLYMLSLLLKTPGEETGNSNVYLMSFDTTLLASRHTQLQTVALKFGQLLSLMTYLHTTIEQMQEAWEDILLEMDSKLQKFAEEKNKVCGGSVSNDFLQLLMFGIPSDELQVFLLHDLTEKGLKKLGHSIETSYSNIQKLVLKHLHR
ncbi:Anaphase-promoting complex subunit 4 [Lamellibrachia satsuma]|nr:Anaphase-promoting complex subunit 4 [Lamellibrachia satsuma]